VTTAQATAKQIEAEAAASKAANEKAQSDLKRDEELKNGNIVSLQELETAKAAADAAAANLRAALENALAERSKVHEAEAQLVAARSVVDVSGAQLQQAKTDVAAAELDLSYTRIFAPADGKVTNKHVEPGDYLQVGQALFALVPTNFWVTANFKETQLRKVHINQRAEVEIDAVRARRFPAHVESIQAGSGSRFSLLPPENAVGNFVKVVQRVPVKIVFEEPLNAAGVVGPGMSVLPSVQTSDFHFSRIVLLIITIVLAALMAKLVWKLTEPKIQTG
jgi:membrane fusion protein (multidrug efflux system)